MAAHDIYAETNPALGSVVLQEFCTAHQLAKGSWPFLPTAYLVLPLTLSEDVAPAFDGSNVKTGLAVWVQRNPRVLAGLAERVNGALEISTAAIQFGALTGVLTLAVDARLSTGSVVAPRALLKGPLAGPLKRARLLGSWFAVAGSERTVMETFGVTV